MRADLIERLRHRADYEDEPDFTIFDAEIMREAADALASQEPDDDALPNGHQIIEQADMLDGRVSQTVQIATTGEEYQRIVHADEAYGDET